MKKRFYILLFTIFFSSLRTQTAFKKYTSVHHDQLYDIKPTLNGGFITCGLTMTLNPSGGSVFVVRTNSFGNTLWSNAYIFGNIVSGSAQSVIPLNNGDFIVAGQAGEPFLMRINSAGQTLWVKSYSTQHKLYFVNAILTSDSNLVMTGTGSNAGEGGVLFLKSDLSGNILIAKSYLSNGYGNWGTNVSELDNGDFLFISEQDVGLKHPFILRINSTGQVVWSKRFENYYSKINSAAELNNGELVFVGTYSGAPGSTIDLLQLKTNSQGGFIKAKRYENAFSAAIIKKSANKLLMFGGSLVETDNDFNLISSKSTSGGLYAAHLLDSEAVAFAGVSGTNGLIAVVNNNLNSGCDEQSAGFIEGSLTFSITNESVTINTLSINILTPATSVSSLNNPMTACETVGLRNRESVGGIDIFPNPFNDYIRIKCFSNEQVELEIYSCLGNEILSTVCKGDKVIQLPDDLPNGLYFVSVNGKLTKIIKE